jgi:ribosomal protein S18 acetylase RimI-like enzyme
MIIPGGLGSRTEMNNETITSWIRTRTDSAELVLSVCTGALLLAKANLLEGLKVTTNRTTMDLLREIVPSNTLVVEDVRYVDNGKILMSAGVTASFDMALHVVSRLFGEERALDTASKLEYHWRASKSFERKPLKGKQKNKRIDIRTAQIEDLNGMQKLYVEAAIWIRSSQGFTQWSEDTFTRDYLEQFISGNDVFVAYLEGELVGCFSIQWKYEDKWGELFHENAGYVYRLVVLRKYKGQGIGNHFLTWAEAYIKNEGKKWLRLDCMADNPVLNQYYRSLGLIFQGRYNGCGWSANLYEREITN